MEPTEKAPHPRLRPRSGRRRSRFSTAVSRIWCEWKVDLLIILLLAASVFLLVERVPIRQTLTGWFVRGLASVATLPSRVFPRLAAIRQSLSPSDLLGFVLMAFALVFVVRRARWRLVTMPRFTNRQCPRCGEALQRIHRTQLDRLINRLVPVRRYMCSNRECRWRGLRFGASRHA